jgi:competence protein ComGC
MEDIMKKRNMLIGSVVAITILATSSAMAFASSENANGGSCDQSRNQAKMTDEQKTIFKDYQNENLNEALVNLVSEGVFTQEEADAIIAAKPADGAKTTESSEPAEHKEKGNEMMQNLTDTQRTALKEKIDLLSEDSINQLVEDGTITQEEADSLSLKKDNKVNKVKDDSKLNLTDEQKTALQDSRLSVIKNAVAELVSEETLTQEEADAIIESVPTEPQERSEKGNEMMKSLTDTQRSALKSEMDTVATANLKALVEDGTITQAQADRMSQIKPIKY